MCSGNLFTAAGFNIMEISTIRRLWPPYYDKIKKAHALPRVVSLLFDLQDIHLIFGK